MTDESFLSPLDSYWTKRGLKPLSSTNEKLILVFHEHWIKYVVPTALYLLLTTASGFLFAFSATASSEPLFVFALVLVLGIHHWYFWFLLAQSQVHIIITSKRVVRIRSGLLWGEDNDEVLFEKMKTVEAHKRNLLQSLFNYGVLQFESTVKMRFIPHPGTLVRTIQQAMGLI